MSSLVQADVPWAARRLADSLGASGPIDMREQTVVPNLLRTDTPPSADASGPSAARLGSMFLNVSQLNSRYHRPVSAYMRLGRSE
jgi:hypothetical protein